MTSQACFDADGLQSAWSSSAVRLPTMQIRPCLLYGLLALLLLQSPAFAEDFKSDDPDTWSSAFSRFIAHRWIAVGKSDAELAGTQFVIICDPDNIGGYFRSLKHLADLREDYRRNPAGWESGAHWQYTCISRNAFRLPRHAGYYRPRQADQDDPAAYGASYKVVREDAGSQVVELRFRDLNAGIYDSFFKYEIARDSVIPIESWVVGRGLAMAVAVKAVVVLLLLSAGLGFLIWLLRLIKRHRVRH